LEEVAQYHSTQAGDGHKHPVAVSSPLATMVGRTKRKHHLEEPEHNIDLIDGVASSYTSRHTKEGYEEQGHQQAPDLAEKILQFPPSIEPKTGTWPYYSSPNASIYTTRFGTSHQSFPASIAAEKDLGSARLTRFDSQEL
jgi:hypothetical protein